MPLRTTNTVEINKQHWKERLIQINWLVIKMTCGYSQRGFCIRQPNIVFICVGCLGITGVPDEHKCMSNAMRISDFCL